MKGGLPAIMSGFQGGEGMDTTNQRKSSLVGEASFTHQATTHLCHLETVLLTCPAPFLGGSTSGQTEPSEAHAGAFIKKGMYSSSSLHYIFGCKACL